MSETSARLALPYLATGQAQKEATHNESLALLDIAVQAVVAAVGVDEPPEAPVSGQCFIIGAAPSGAWVGHAQALAGWTGGGWRFVAAFDGLEVFDGATGRQLRFDGSAWVVPALDAATVRVDGNVVVGSRQPAVSLPAGGGVIDAEARAAIAALIARLEAHGLIAAA